MNINLTSNLQSVIETAKREALKNNRGVILPIHLFAALLEERKGTCKELFFYITLQNKYNLVFDYLQKKQDGVSELVFGKEVFSNNTIIVMKLAEENMKRYKQIYLNVGHVMSALFQTNQKFLNELFSEVERNKIKEIMCYSRDLMVDLSKYECEEVSEGDSIVNRANVYNKEEILNFVRGNFSEDWVESVQNALRNENITLFIATRDEEIIGFSCYDAYLNLKGIFGPMGLSQENKNNGIGKKLLHITLQDMKATGYNYAIIKEAGPIEFYEKNCQTILVPKI